MGRSGSGGGGKFPPSYSPSKLRTAAECGAKYEFAYVNKLPFPAKANIALGTWMDEAANLVWLHKLHEGTLYDVDKAIDYASSTFEATVLKAVPEWDLETDPVTVRDRVLVAFREYLTTWYVRLVPVKVQAWCGLPEGVIGRLGLRGRLDLLSREPDGLVVNDLKVKGAVYYSKASGTPGPKIMAKISRDLQLMSYAASVAEEGEAPIRVRWIGLVWTANPQVQHVELALTAQLIRWYMNAARNAARTIEAGQFLPNPTAEYCPTCDYAKECMDKFGAA